MDEIKITDLKEEDYDSFVKRITKAELLERLKKSEEDRIKLEETMERNKEQLEQDFSFSRTPEEASDHIKAQRKKDAIKRMTHGRWTSQEKYEEYLENQNKPVRM